VAATSPLAVELLVAAFAGGAFGAAVGALQSFALAGLVVVVGELYAMAVETVGGTPVVDVTGSVAFGPVLGPHVAFAGGAGAVAYAARKGYLDGEFDYHRAKNVTTGLGSRPDVLAVGGVFGVVGHLVAAGSGALAVPVDPVALGVVGSALAHRLALGYSVIGARPGRLLDMSPFEAQVATDGGGTATDGGGESVVDSGHAVEPWLPYQYRWSHVAALGVAMGALGGYVAYLTASPFLAFGISVVALAFLCAGVADIPVTHHMTLPASTAALALVDAPAAGLTPTLVRESVALGPVVLVGVAFGLVGALVGELLQRVFYAHAETHLDPPAASIVVTSLLLGVLSMVGVLPSAVWVPTPG
jgi:hypothetical protein